MNWNELKIRIAREKKPIDPQVLLKWMTMRENGMSIRVLIPPDDQSIIAEITRKGEFEDGESHKMADVTRAVSGIS